MKEYSFIDLHTHTVYSREPGCDDSIEDVFAEAQKIAERSGKDCLIAITDHNTVLGISEARKILATGKYDKVKLISGAEFTVDMSQLNGIFGGKKVFGNCHILAYGFDENNPELIEFSKKFHSGKRGYLNFRELVDIMKKAGGKLVIAHPGLIKVHPSGLSGYNGTNIEYQRAFYDMSKGSNSKKTIMRYVRNSKLLLQIFVERVMKLGGGIVVGMERFHPDNYVHNFDKSIEEICQKNGLIQTAGSDFHGYHLHTEFSVGNPFTTGFQEYYKDLLGDCKEYRNGIHVSSLPGLEILNGKEEAKNEVNKQPRFKNGNGEDVTYDQYNQVVDYFTSEMKKKNLENSPSRYRETKKSNQSSNKNNYKHKSKKKGKKQKYYYPDQDDYS